MEIKAPIERRRMRSLICLDDTLRLVSDEQWLTDDGWVTMRNTREVERDLTQDEAFEALGIDRHTPLPPTLLGSAEYRTGED